MNKCNGCGVTLQNTGNNDLGYTTNLDSDFCERCFRIKNYGEYKVVVKDNNDFINILKDINKTKDLVVLVVDLFQMNNDLKFIKENLENNNILLVLTKRDLLPSVYDKKLLDYFNEMEIEFIDKIIVSSKNNLNFDELYELIYKYKKGNNVYVVGYTNAGKSTLINKIIYNYSDLNLEITTSMLPSTTLEQIEIKLNEELTLIDTPGILDLGSIINYLDGKKLKQVLPKKSVKPITYQIKEKQYLHIDELVKIELENNDITLFIANNLVINRYYKDNDKLSNLVTHKIEIKEKCDIVISGLGFIKITKPGTLLISTLPNVSVYTRKSLI